MAAPTFNINPAFTGANLGANAGRQQQAGGNAQKFANRLQNVTLGSAVLRTPGVTGNDIPEGKYMGYGTAQNRGSFNTKETALLTPEVANALNNLLGQQGSEGILPEGMTQYLPDEKARIFVDRSGNGPALVLPGSQQHEAANQAGSAAGLVQIQNPYKDTGYARVGGPTWLKTIQQFAFEATQRIPTNNVSREDMEHFIAQAGVYGFGPIFNQFRVRIIPDTYTDPEGRTFARYRLGNGFDPVKIANYRPLLQGVAQRYGQIMKNPDQQALGRYGAANLALRHAEHLTDANGQAGMEAVNQAVLDAWNNGRSVAGAFHWQPGYRTFEGRRGLTAFPKRTQDGRALAANGRSLASSKNAGFCNIAGSGPGISQSARPGGDYGFRFYPQGRKYVSYKKGQQGLKLAPESWSCGFTPDYVVNPYSQRYQAGGKYALRGMSLGQALNQIGQAHPDLAGYTEQDLANRYVDWSLNPGNYGTNEAFMLPATQADIDPATGFFRQGSQHGFSKAAPARLRAAGINVSSNVSATIDQKAARSDQLIREVTGQAQGQNFGGFAAASVPQARSANRGRSGVRGSALSQRAANLLGTAPAVPRQ